jgi:hypothetical protein
MSARMGQAFLLSRTRLAGQPGALQAPLGAWASRQIKSTHKEQHAMRRIRITGLAFAAVLAVGALSAMTMAGTAAAANPEILPVPSAEKPIEFLDDGGAGELLTLGKKTVKCEKNKSKGSATSPKLGKFEIHFEGCTSSGVKCTGLGEEKPGDILIKAASFHFWYGLLSKEKQPAFVILLEETVHFTCGGLVLVEVLNKGCVAGLVLETNKLVKSFKVDFLEEAGNAGDPDFLEVLNEEGKEISCKLLVRTNDAGEEDDGAILGTDTVDTFKQGGVAIEVLLMA